MWYNALLMGVVNVSYMVDIRNLSEMQEFAEKVANLVFPGFVLCLEGDLGAGKTTFTQFFAKALGVKSSVNSPTFTIMKTYDEGSYHLTHIDAYRLEGVGLDLELEEQMDNDGVTVIEWYQYIVESLPEFFLSIHIQFVDEHRRRLEIKGSGKYESIAKAIGY